MRKLLIAFSLAALFLFSMANIISAKEKFETNINVINESVTDSGITLTVNSTTVKNGELTFQYTVGHDEKQQYNFDNGVTGGKPEIIISGQKIVPHTVNTEQERNGKYTGKAVVNLPRNLDIDSNMKFSVNDILGKSGSWNLNL